MKFLDTDDKSCGFSVDNIPAENMVEFTIFTSTGYSRFKTNNPETLRMIADELYRLADRVEFIKNG